MEIFRLYECVYIYIHTGIYWFVIYVVIFLYHEVVSVIVEANCITISNGISLFRLAYNTETLITIQYYQLNILIVCVCYWIIVLMLVRHAGLEHRNQLDDVLLSGVPDYFDRNKISSGGDLSHYSSASLY